VVRDPEQEASFRRNVTGVEARCGRYVVVATNVVEMGVTFPSLDYVVTMDTELETVRAHGGENVHERPLGVNAFLQRIGRVGRRRPGMALLTREGDNGAAFSAWDASALATQLRLEPISFATTRGDVRELAFYLYQREVAPDRKSVTEFLARGRMPSRPEQDTGVLDALVAERTAIRTAKLSDDGRRFNSRGERFRKIGVINDLELGSLFADSLSGGPGSALPFLALVTAANPGGLRDLLGRRTWLDDDEPVLSHAVPFARDAFRMPLADVVRVLRSGMSPVNPKAIGAEEVVAGHLTELLADGYRINDPQFVERKGEKEEPALLTLSRASIRLDPASELLAVYDIVRWFVMRYRPDLADTTLVDHERERVRAAAREDARLLGLDARRLLGVAARMEEIARHADMDLGEDLPPARLPDEYVARLATAAAVHRTDTDASTLRREILRVYRENVRPRPTADLPETSLDDRRRFHRTIKNLELFTTVELKPGEDIRGRAAFLGVDPRTGNQIVVEKSRTCLRLRDRTLVRGRVVPVSGVDRDGNETMRYVLTLAHVEAR
jgi:hypothetical protein